MGCLYGAWRGYSGHEFSYLLESLGGVGCMKGPCFYQAMSKLITVRSTGGIILCLSVLLCDYTEVNNIQCTIICSICDYNFTFIILL